MENFNDDISENSSDDDTDEPGHPVEDKGTVLKNLQAGFKYHKNGPAQMYDWNKDDIAKMTQIIHQSVSTLKKGRRKIRATDYKGNVLPNGILGWVNSVRRGDYFGDNPKVNRGPVFKSGEKSNFWLWNFVSETLLAEFDYWTEVHKQNAKVDPKNTKYPDIMKGKLEG